MKNRRPRERQGKSRKTIGKSVENAKPGPAGKAVNFPHRMKNGPRHFRLSEFKVQQIVLHYLDVVGAFFFVNVVGFFPAGKPGGCIRFVGKWQKLIIILNSVLPFAFVSV